MRDRQIERRVLDFLYTMSVSPDIIAMKHTKGIRIYLFYGADAYDK